MHLSCNNDDAAGRGSARQTRLVDLAIPGRIPLGDPLPEWNLLCSALYAHGMRPPLYRYLPFCLQTKPNARRWLYVLLPAKLHLQPKLPLRPPALTFLLTHYRYI
jgi:hypothetical protein